MNYSQRNHLERLMSGAPPEADPFGLRMPFGAHFKLVQSPDVPRYQLPAEVMPGVPWPAGFRDSFNRWSTDFLGTTNVIPRGTAYMLAGGYTVMNPRDAVMLTGLV